MTPRPKVGVINTVLSNTGDAAIFQSIVVSLRATYGQDGVDVLAFDGQADVTTKLYPHWHIRQQLTQPRPAGGPKPAKVALLVRCLALLGLSGWPQLLRFVAGSRPLRRTSFAQAFREMASCDLIISSGGTYLVDHYNFLHRAVEIRVAKSMGKRVLLWTQSMGPFRTRRARWLARLLSPSVDDAFFRDGPSAAAWTRVTGRAVPETHIVADAAFALSKPLGSAETATVPPRALISVRAWSRGVLTDDFDASAYGAMMRSAVTTLVGLNWSCIALSTCQGVPEYAYDDSEVARDIFRDLSVYVDAGFHTPDQLLSELQEAGLVIATRMHLAILALASGVATIAIAYEFKTIELFKSLGLGDHAILIERANIDWMQAKVRQAITSPNSFRLSPHLREALRVSATSPALLALSSSAVD